MLFYQGIFVGIGLAIGIAALVQSIQRLKEFNSKMKEKYGTWI
jgi:hypothetical protein